MSLIFIHFIISGAIIDELLIATVGIFGKVLHMAL